MSSNGGARSASNDSAEQILQRVKSDMKIVKFQNMKIHDQRKAKQDRRKQYGAVINELQSVSNKYRDFDQEYPIDQTYE